MRCLLCGNKVPRLRYWKTKSEFCSDDHADSHKRQTLDRLMQAQEELLSPAPLPVRSDSDSILSQSRSPVPEAGADTTPRVDRSHRLPAAENRGEAAAEPATSESAPGGQFFESLEVRRANLEAQDSTEPDPQQTEPAEPAASESAHKASSEFTNPLRWLMDATAPTPIFDGPELTALQGEQRSPEQLPFEVVDEDLPGESAAGGIPGEAFDDHDAILRRLMGGDGERPALSDLLDQEEDGTAAKPGFEDALEHVDALKSDEMGDGRPEAGADFSLQELLDGIGKPPEPPSVDEDPPEDTVYLNQFGEGTVDLTDELVPATLPDGYAWEHAGEGCELSEPDAALGIPEVGTINYEVAATGLPDPTIVVSPCELRGIATQEQRDSASHSGALSVSVELRFLDETAPTAVLEQISATGRGDAAADTVEPQLPLSIPNFEGRPLRSSGFAAWPSGMSEMADGIGMFVAPADSGQPELRNDEPLPLSPTVPAPTPGMGLEWSTSPSYALRSVEWTSARATGVTLRFDDACEVGSIEAGQELISPEGGCRAPEFALEPVPGEERHRGIRPAGTFSLPPLEATEGEFVVFEYQPEMIAAFSECRVPGVGIEGLPGKFCYRGITPTDMVSWVIPEAIVEHRLPGFANWTGAVGPPRREIGVPAALLNGAIRSLRQFPRFGYLLQSDGGAALMQGVTPPDTSGMLPILALTEQGSQPQPSLALQVDSNEVDLDAIVPVASVYAPADLDPFEYA